MYLKTTKNVDEYNFNRSCEEYGYFRQQAFYQMLMKEMMPELEWFESRILAVENSTPYYRCGLFKINQNRIRFEQHLLEQIIPVIAAEKDFAPQNLSWQEAKEIGYQS